MRIAKYSYSAAVAPVVAVAAMAAEAAMAAMVASAGVPVFALLLDLRVQLLLLGRQYAENCFFGFHTKGAYLRADELHGLVVKGVTFLGGFLQDNQHVHGLLVVEIQGLADAGKFLFNTRRFALPVTSAPLLLGEHAPRHQ